MSLATKCDNCGKLMHDDPDMHIGTIRIYGSLQIFGRDTSSVSIEDGDFTDFCDIECLSEAVAAAKKELLG